MIKLQELSHLGFWTPFELDSPSVHHSVRTSTFDINLLCHLVLSALTASLNTIPLSL
jgi:hypothetical protein